MLPPDRSEDIALDTPIGIQDAPGARDCGRLSGAIELDHVSLQYPRGDVALNDVSFEVPAGSSLGVIGGDGAAKSQH